MEVPEGPKFKTYKEGEPIPPVDSEDIRRTWEYDRTHNPVGTKGWDWLLNRQAVCSPGADVWDVAHRHRMIETLITYKLLTPWHHGEELNDAVFRIAATFPLREFHPHDYMIPGDEHFGFDPNAFVQQLEAETGIAGTGKTVPTKVGEGGRAWGGSPIEYRNDSPERRAEHKARGLLWMIFKRLSPSLDLTSIQNPVNAANFAALFFADFMLDNIDLVRKLEDGYKKQEFVEIDLREELERKARRWA